MSGGNNMKRWFAANYIYLIVLGILSLILIFYVFPSRSLDYINYDSSYQYFLTQHSLKEICRLLPTDFSPPLYAIVLKLFCMVFGHTLYVMRVLNMLFVIGMFALALFPLRRLFGAQTGILCAVLCLCAHSIIYFMAEIRPNFPAMLIMMAACIYGCDVFANRTGYSYIMLTVFSILACYCHNIAMLGAIGIYLALLLGNLIRRDFVDLRKVLISGVIVAVTYVPWLFVVFHQFGNVTANYWSTQKSISDIISQTIRYTFRHYHSSPILTLLFDLSYILGFGLLIWKLYKRIRKEKKLCLTSEEKGTIQATCIVATEFLCGLLVYTAFIFFVYNFNTWRYCSILSMEWIVLISIILGKYPRRPIPYILSLLLLLGLIVTITDVKEINAQSEISEMREQYGNGEGFAFLHANEYTLGICMYYFPNAQHYVCDDTYSVLTTYDAFGKSDVIEIGDVNNIWDYEDSILLINYGNSQYPLRKLEQSGCKSEKCQKKGYYDSWSYVRDWGFICVTRPSE